MNKSIEKISKEKALEIIELEKKILDLIKHKKELINTYKKFLKENEIHFLDNVELAALDKF